LLYYNITKMKTLKKFLLASILSLIGLTNLLIFNVASAQSVYSDVLSNTINSGSLSSAINWWDVVTDNISGWNLFNNQIMVIVW